MALAIASAASLFKKIPCSQNWQMYLRQGFCHGQVLHQTSHTPRQHSIQCLVNDGWCVNSGFEILFGPPEGQDLYQCAWGADSCACYWCM
eukprot:965585-Ditylum_brightwellii.AAC.1